MKMYLALALLFFAASARAENFPLEEWRAKAYEFAANDFSGYRDERLSYLLRVIEDPKFQENPEQYLANWTERRGWTREYRFVEDAALEFFRAGSP